MLWGAVVKTHQHVYFFISLSVFLPHPLFCSHTHTHTHTHWFNGPASLNGYNNSFAKYQRSMQCHQTPPNPPPRNTHTHTHHHHWVLNKFAKCSFMACELALTLHSRKVESCTRVSLAFQIFTIRFSWSALVRPTPAPAARRRARCREDRNDSYPIVSSACGESN